MNLNQSPVAQEENAADYSGPLWTEEEYQQESLLQERG